MMCYYLNVHFQGQRVKQLSQVEENSINPCEYFTDYVISSHCHYSPRVLRNLATLPIQELLNQLFRFSRV